MHHLLRSPFASQSKTRSSQPTEATQPPEPNRHQSTPVANSVWRFINPICAPPLIGGGAS